MGLEGELFYIIGLGKGFEGEVGGSVERFAGSVRAFKNVFMLPEKTRLKNWGEIYIRNPLLWVGVRAYFFRFAVQLLPPYRQNVT